MPRKDNELPQDLNLTVNRLLATIDPATGKRYKASIGQFINMSNAVAVGQMYTGTPITTTSTPGVVTGKPVWTYLANNSTASVTYSNLNGIVLAANTLNVLQWTGAIWQLATSIVLPAGLSEDEVKAQIANSDLAANVNNLLTNSDESPTTYPDTAWVVGAITNGTGVLDTNKNIKHILISINEGDTVEYYTVGATAWDRAWTYDSAGNPIAAVGKFTSQTALTKYTYTATTDTTLGVHTVVITTSGATGFASGFYAKVTPANATPYYLTPSNVGVEVAKQSDLAIIKTNNNTAIKGGVELLTIDGSWIQANGTVGTGATAGKDKRSDFIAVKKGAVITAYSCAPKTGNVISFYATATESTYVSGVAGTSAYQMASYVFTAPTDGYVRIYCSSYSYATALTEFSLKILASNLDDAIFITPDQLDLPNSAMSVIKGANPFAFNQSGFLLSDFMGADNDLQNGIFIHYSLDGKTFYNTNNLQPNFTDMTGTTNNGFRDASITYVNGVFYVCKSPYNWGSQNFFRIFKSIDLYNWELVIQITDTEMVTAWAPEWFVDSDGSVYIFYTGDTNSGTSYSSASKVARFIKSTATDLSAWSIPSSVGGIADSAIDWYPFLNSDGYYYAIGATWNTSAQGKEPWVIYRSTSLTSGYSSYKTNAQLQADGCPFYSGFEAPCVVRIDSSTLRVYADYLNANGGVGLTYCECDNNFENWKTGSRLTLVGGKHKLRHGTVIRINNNKVWRLAMQH